MPNAMTTIAKASAANTNTGTSAPIPLPATVLSIICLLFFLSLEIRLHSDAVNEERARLLVSARVYHELYIRREMDAHAYGGVRERVIVIELEVMLCAGVSRGVVPQVLLVRVAHEGGAVAEAQVVVGPAAWRREARPGADKPVALGDPLPLAARPAPEAH